MVVVDSTATFSDNMIDDVTDDDSNRWSRKCYDIDEREVQRTFIFKSSTSGLYFFPLFFLFFINEIIFYKTVRFVQSKSIISSRFLFRDIFSFLNNLLPIIIIILFSHLNLVMKTVYYFDT